VPTGEPCNTETVPHGSVRGRGKRRVSDLARGLPNLRSRFRQQVSASVDMTSDVKAWEQLFYVCILISFLLSLGGGGASKTRRLITLLSVGWLPPSVPPSGACLIRGTSVPCGLVTLPRVAPNRGCASSDGRENLGVLWLQTSSRLYAFGVTATCFAIAHIKALNSRAMATTT